MPPTSTQEVTREDQEEKKQRLTPCFRLPRACAVIRILEVEASGPLHDLMPCASWAFSECLGQTISRWGSS